MPPPSPAPSPATDPGSPPRAACATSPTRPSCARPPCSSSRLSLIGLREDDAVVSYHPDPPQLLRARLRLALHSRGGEEPNRLVHHERGRYFVSAPQYDR